MAVGEVVTQSEIYQPDAMVGQTKLWRAPAAVVAEAKEAADTLRAIIDGSDNKPVRFGDKEHLKHEHWEILGHFFGYCTKIEHTGPVEFEQEDGSKVSGFEASALLLNERTGLVVGRAEAMCLDNEEMWGEVAEYEYQDTFNREGRKVGRERVQIGTKAKPLFQLRSMAQTRASGKAFRHKLAWVAVLAGYSPTPEAEMTGVRTKQEPAADSLPTEIKRKPLTPDFAKEAPAPRAAKPPQSVPSRAAAPARALEFISDGQSRRFYALWKQAGKTRSLVTNYLLETFGIDDDRKMPADRYEEACAWAQKDGF